MISTIHTARILILFVAFVLFSACGPGVEEGPLPMDTNSFADGDTDTDTDTDSDADGDADPVFCPEELSPTCSSMANLNIPEEIFTASLFGDDWEFQTMSTNTILAEGTLNGKMRSILINLSFDSDMPETVASYGIVPNNEYGSSSILDITAAADEMVGSPYNRMAMVSKEDSLYLYGTSFNFPGEIAELEEISNSRLSLMSVGTIRGIEYLANKTTLDGALFDRICVFGNGLLCFDGDGWEEEIPTDPDLEINALGILEGNLLVVGDGGRVLLEGDTGWSELEVETDEDLLAVSISYNRFTAAGTNGILVNGNATETRVCETDAGTFERLNYPGGSSSADYFMAMNTAGEMIGGWLLPEEDGWLCNTTYAFENVKDGHFLSADYYVLTRDALYGQSGGETIVIE